MNHPTLKRILSMDKWAHVTVDRDMIGSKFGIYNPDEGIVYLSQAQYDLWWDAPDVMETQILCIDLGQSVKKAVAVR